MEIVLHDDTAEYAAVARPLLDRDPDRHTMALTVLDALVRSGERAAVLLTVHDRGRVVAAAQCSVGRPLLVSAVPPELSAAVDRALGDSGTVLARPAEAGAGSAGSAGDVVDSGMLSGAVGPVSEVQAFAAAHRARTGATVEMVMRMRLFALGALVPPAGVPGTARRATGADLDVLAAWRAAFAAEGGHGWSGPFTPHEQAARSLAVGAAEWLWEVDGRPAALAVARPVVAGMSRIGPVYTVPGQRSRGFGGAVTAAAARWALEAGARSVLLFTDLANPTSNALYPRLGFRPLHDALEVRFAC